MVLMGDVTRLLNDLEGGDRRAADELFPIVYGELRRLAAARMVQESPGHTLEPTALVHEVYLRLVGAEPRDRWEGERHFLGAAAEAMRRILIERAREKGRLKRGGDRDRVPLTHADGFELDGVEDLLDLDAALEELERSEAPVKSEVVKLRFFAGLGAAEAAAALGISKATCDRHWAYARSWLFHRLHGGGS